jgi:hypothetical protein
MSVEAEDYEKLKDLVLYAYDELLTLMADWKPVVNVVINNDGVRSVIEIWPDKEIFERDKNLLH